MYNDRNMNTNTMAWRTQNGQKPLTFNVAWQLGIAEAQRKRFFSKKEIILKIYEIFISFLNMLLIAAIAKI